jgi:Family of unknown function (DUF6338)
MCSHCITGNGDASLIGTFQALAVALIAVLPGACFIFAFEGAARDARLTVTDRLLRALAISAIFHAMVSGGSYLLWRHAIRSGDLAAGRVSPWIVELATLLYVVAPTAAGFALGIIGQDKPQWTEGFIGTRPDDAWNDLWRNARPGFVRLKLRSGEWVGGYYSTRPDGRYSIAGGSAEQGDLFLSRRATVNLADGAFEVDASGNVLLSDTGLLVRWDEVLVLLLDEGEDD